MARILVVDDDPAVSASLGRALERAGHTPVFAHDGHTALELFVTGRPDLVITDIMMPGMDGAALIRRIKSVEPHCPIIAISGSDTAWATAQQFGWTGWGSPAASPLAQARMGGADVTIAKPVELATLLEAVQGLLERSRPKVDALADEAEVSYHIRPDEHARWAVHRNGSERAIMRASTREDALLIARRLAAGARSSSIIVYNPDGSVAQRISYAGHEVR